MYASMESFPAFMYYLTFKLPKDVLFHHWSVSFRAPGLGQSLDVADWDHIEHCTS